MREDFPNLTDEQYQEYLDYTSCKEPIKVEQQGIVRPTHIDYNKKARIKARKKAKTAKAARKVNYKHNKRK